MKRIKAFALIDKETGNLCRNAIHVLKTDCPYAIYETEDFLENTEKGTKVVPIEIIFKNSKE